MVDTVTLIDVICIKPKTDEIVSGFEIEKSRSICSGILRLEDLPHSIPGTLPLDWHRPCVTAEADI